MRYPVEIDINVSEQCYDEIRKKLVSLGDGGVITERGDRRSINLTGVTIVTRGSQDIRHQSPSLTKLRDR